MAVNHSTYLFYDIETTGLNKCFDQVLQFAAIRTDLSLNEIERYQIQIKLNPDVIPSPEAVITHRISIEKMQQGISEWDAIQKIHALLNTPGTISLGYNTLGFDDEFLRFSFYRHLLPPYTHQFNNQCRRMDIYPITVLYYLYKNETLKWPKIAGKCSLKLEHINQANQWVTGQAHDAIVDVEATLALTRALFSEKEMWDFVSGYFEKNTDLERLQRLPFSLKFSDQQFQEGLLISGKLGEHLQYQSPVMCLGSHQHYRNQTLWLRLDDENLTKTTADTLALHTYVIRKRAAEQPIILEAKPRFLKYLSEERRHLTDLNRLWLLQNPKLVNKIIEYHQHYKYPQVADIDAEAALYETGFPSPFEEKIFQQFHRAKPKDKESIAQQLSDPIRRELAMRLLARHFPQHLSLENQKFYQTYQQQIFTNSNPPIDYRGEKHLTPQEALQRITAIRAKELDSQQQQLLKDLENYLLGSVYNS